MNENKKLELSEIRFVKRISVGNINPNNLLSEDLINFESTRKNSGRPKVKFNITFIQGEVPEAVMKINDNFINKFITFS